MLHLFTGPGDFVEADEIIARIETDKVTVDIISPEAGVIKEFMAAEGDSVDVGADFYILDTDGKGSSGGAAPAAPKAEAAPAATPAPAAPAAPAAAKTPTPPPPPPKSVPAQAPSGGAATKSVSAKKAPTTIGGTRTETRVPMSRMR